MNAIFVAITAACNAYAKWVDYQLANHKEETANELEDEIDALAADGGGAAILRIERLKQRLATVRKS